MYRNLLAATISNLARNRVYAIITIFGLAAGLTVALLVTALVRNQMSFDQFLPGYDRTFAITTHLEQPGQAPQWFGAAPPQVARQLASQAPFVEASARLWPALAGISHSGVVTNELVQWADSGFFQVMPFAAAQGDPATALTRPDAVVITQRMARKYFGASPALGGVLTIDHQDFTVTAVLKDLPSNTHVGGDIFASSANVASPLRNSDAATATVDVNRLTPTYVRVKTAADGVRLASMLPDFVKSNLSPGLGTRLTLTTLPLKDIHLKGPGQGGGKPGGNIAAVVAISIVGGMILAVACVNFINLMTARATRRALEVGVRKAFGARRRDLIVQFIGEALIYAAASMLVALAVAELSLPSLNAFMNSDASLAYWRDPEVIGLIVALLLVVGVLAGAYPALVLSGLRPASALRALAGKMGGRGGLVRQGLVVFQFAVLITLGLVTTVIYRQTLFSMSQGLASGDDKIVLVSTLCTPALVSEMARSPGIAAATCSEAAPTGQGRAATASGAGRTPISLWQSAVGPGFFEFYGHPSIAGRLPDPNRPADLGPGPGNGDVDAPVVLNRAAVRSLGFANPAAAVGEDINWTSQPGRSQVIGVVEDFPAGPITDAIQPAAYYVDPARFSLLSVKLSAAPTAASLPEIEQIWRAMGGQGQIDDIFLRNYVASEYLGIARTGQTLGGFAAITLVIACLGLFGLAAFTAEQRTKEIGVRKAFGAGTASVVGLLLWQFTRPVLLANLIALPLGYLVMRAWLAGFAYHVALDPLDFVAVGALTLAIAWLTVAFHSYTVARSKPADALRYE